MNKKIIKLWKMPVLMALLCFYGLISALIGGVVWDIAACVCLAIPIFVVLRNYYKKPDTDFKNQ